MSEAVIAALLALFAVASGTVIVYTKEIPHGIAQEYEDMPGKFGGGVPPDGLRGFLVVANPPNGCSNLTQPPVDNDYKGKWIVLIARYDCDFETKVRNAQLAGYDCAIVHNVNSSDLETMYAKNADDIVIPSVFISDYAGRALAELYHYDNGYYIMVNGDMPFNINTHLLLPFAVVVVLCLVVILISTIVKCARDRRRARRHRLPNRSLKKIPTCKFSKVVPYETCAICLDDYQEGDRLRVLPCAHAYHAKCVDPWLTQNRRVCPVCKRRVFAAGERRAQRHDSDTSDTEPLVGSQDSHNQTQGGTFDEQRENPFQRAARLMRQWRQQRHRNATDTENLTFRTLCSVRGRRKTKETAVQTAEEIDHTNNDNDEIEGGGDEDTRPLLAPVVSTVTERPRRSRRRRARSASAAAAAARPPQPPLRSSTGHSINTDEQGEIGVAALPAAPLASSTPHHIDL